MKSASKIQTLFRARKGRAELQARQNKWIKERDPNSGHYYYCELLKLVHTCSPPTFQHLSSPSSLFYTDNTITQQSQWEEPPDFVPGGRNEEMVSASKLQALFRGNKQRKEVEEKMHKYKKQIAELKAKAKVWIKGYDPNSGLYYYWNSETQVSQWEQPADYVDGGVNELMQAALKIQCAYRSRKARREYFLRRRPGGRGRGRCCRLHAFLFFTLHSKVALNSLLPFL